MERRESIVEIFRDEKTFVQDSLFKAETEKFMDIILSENFFKVPRKNKTEKDVHYTIASLQRGDLPSGSSTFQRVMLEIGSPKRRRKSRD